MKKSGMKNPEMENSRRHSDMPAAVFILFPISTITISYPNFSTITIPSAAALHPNSCRP